MVTVMKYINFEQHTCSIPNVIYCHVRGKVVFIIAHLLIYMIILKNLKKFKFNGKMGGSMYIKNITSKKYILNKNSV